MQKKLPFLVPVQPPPQPTSNPAPALPSAPSLPPVLPLVPMTSLSHCPLPASVTTSRSDQPGPLSTSCPDHLPPLRGFSSSHLSARVTSTLACPPAPPTTCLLPLPLPSIRRPFRLAPLFSHTPPLTPGPPPYTDSSPSCMGLGPR